MLMIGLTGGIATGKGVVAAIWAAQPGVEVHDADEVVHALYQSGSPMVDALVEAFGPNILSEDGGINRQALGEIVFNDKQARLRLNDIVHPAVRNQYLQLAIQAEKSGTEVFVIEAALLLDGNPDHTFFNAFVTTEVEHSEQVRRLIKRDTLSEADALKRIASQLPSAVRRERADYVLDTSGTVAETQQRALRLLNFLWQQQQA